METEHWFDGMQGVDTGDARQLERMRSLYSAVAITHMSGAEAKAALLSLGQFAGQSAQESRSRLHRVLWGLTACAPEPQRRVGQKSRRQYDDFQYGVSTGSSPWSTEENGAQLARFRRLYPKDTIAHLTGGEAKSLLSNLGVRGCSGLAADVARIKLRTALWPDVDISSSEDDDGNESDEPEFECVPSK